MVEVGVVVGNELGRYAQWDVHRCVVLTEVLEITVGFKLHNPKGLASPDLVHKTCGSIATPRATTITFLTVLELIGAVPNTKGLDGYELVVLGVGEPSGGNVVG